MAMTLDILALVLLVLACAAGLGLTLIGLSGAWLMVLAGVIVAAWRPAQLGWEPVAWAGGLAALAEAIEFLAGALGASRAGASKRAIVGAMVGGLVGAVLGTPIFPIVGTILGGAIGAGAAAAALELSVAPDQRANPRQVALGAFVGRIVAVLAKSALAATTAVLLVWSAAT